MEEKMTYDQWLDTKTYEYFIDLEQKRQNENVELIASENFPSKRILDAAGSILTNKYAERLSWKEILWRMLSY